MASNNSKYGQKKRPFVKNEKQIIINQIDVRPVNRQNVDLDKWRSALKNAEGVNQQRNALYDLYEDILLDGRLTRLIGKRIDAIKNTELTFVDEAGKDVDEIKKIIDTPWFEEALHEIMNTIFWGYTLLELDWPAPGEERPGTTTLIKRHHVKPRFGIVTKTPFEVTGMPYHEPPYSNWTIACGNKEGLGLLLQCCPWVILKRNNVSDWAEFAEVFGMPTRIGEYNNEQTRQVLKEVFDNIGAAGKIVVPAGTNIQNLEAKVNTEGKIFENLRLACNEELAVTTLGVTETTTASSSSGYAQSKTHENVQEGVHKADRRFAKRILDNQVRAHLALLGYPAAKGKFKYVDEDDIPLTERIDLDLKVAGKVPVEDDYFYEKYGIPKPENYEQMKAEQQAEKEAWKEDQKENNGKPGNNKKSLSEKVRHFFV